MSAYLTDKNIPHYKLYHDNQTIIISLYIEYIMLIAYIICSWEIGFYIRQALPSRPLCNIIPPLERNTRIFPPTCLIKFP